MAFDDVNDLDFGPLVRALLRPFAIETAGAVIVSLGSCQNDENVLSFIPVENTSRLQVVSIKHCDSSPLNWQLSLSDDSPSGVVGSSSSVGPAQDFVSRAFQPPALASSLLRSVPFYQTQCSTRLREVATL